jgi:hypothetical protein
MSAREVIRRKATVSLDDGQPLAALAAAVGEDLAAADGGFTGEETDLTGALDAVRAECGLHGFKWLRGD